MKVRMEALSPWRVNAPTQHNGGGPGELSGFRPAPCSQGTLDDFTWVGGTTEFY